MKDERSAIVAWLREKEVDARGRLKKLSCQRSKENVRGEVNAYRIAAQLIERGQHLKDSQ